MAQEFVKTQIKGDKVVVFLKPSCPYCVLAKDVLSKYSFKSGHLEFIDISSLDNMGAIQDYLQQLTGARTVSHLSTPLSYSLIVQRYFCSLHVFMMPFLKNVRKVVFLDAFRIVRNFV